MISHQSGPLLQYHVVEEAKPIKTLVKAYIYSFSRFRGNRVLKFVNAFFFLLPCRVEVFYTASFNGKGIAVIVYHAGCD